MKKTMKPAKAGWIYAWIHFSLEVACFTWMMHHAIEWSAERYCIMAFLYDALAFVPQSLVGALTDRFPKMKIGPAGAVLIIAGLVLPIPAIAFVFIVAGNCMIHVAGAQATLRGANGKLGPSGIFVAGGSFGVITGTLLGSITQDWVLYIPLGLMILAFFLSLYVSDRIDMEAESEGFHIAAQLPVGWIVALTMVVIMARSYVGYAIPTAWKQETWQTILLYVFMGIGKAAGGVCADRFGARRTAVWSLLCAIPFLVFGNRLMVISLIGIAFFSMTMAISLGAVVSVLPDNPGCSFGVTTVALFLGTAPVFFVRPSTLEEQIVIVTILTVVAAVCCFITLKGQNKEGMEA